MALTPAQKTAVKAAVQGDATLNPQWIAGRRGDVCNALNTPDQTGDVDVAKTRALRVLVGRNLGGKILARIEILKMQIQAVYQRAADLQTTVPLASTAVQGLNISATEAKLAALYNAWNLFSALETISFSDGPTKTFVGATADAMVTEGVFVAADKTAIMALGTGSVSRAQQLVGGPLSEGDLVEAMV